MAFNRIFKKSTPGEFCLVFDKDYLAIVDGTLIQRGKDEPESKHWGILTNIHEEKIGQAPVLIVHYTQSKKAPDSKAAEVSENKEPQKINEALFALTKHGWVWYLNADRIKADIESRTIKAETNLAKKHISSFLELLKKSGFELSKLYFDNKIYQTDDVKFAQFAEDVSKAVTFKKTDPGAEYKRKV